MKKRDCRVLLWVLCVSLVLVANWTQAGEIPRAIVIVEGSEATPPLPVSININFAGIRDAFGLKEGIKPENVQAALLGEDGKLSPVPTQFDPDVRYDPVKNPSGTLSVLLEPSSNQQKIAVYFTSQAPFKPVKPAQGEGIKVEEKDGKITVSNEYYKVVHNPSANGGMPSEITFRKTGKVFEGFFLNDRVYNAGMGCFWLRNDPEPKVRVLAKGPLQTTVQIVSRYCADGGRQTESQASATYEFNYFAGLPVVRVKANIRQEQAFSWSELHFIEIFFSDESFISWACGDPFQKGLFKALKKGWTASRWGALVDGESVLGLITKEDVVRYYDGRGDYGTYLHGPWVTWDSAERQFEGLLWIGSAEDANAVKEKAGSSQISLRNAYVTAEPLQDALNRLNNKADQMPPAEGGRLKWALSIIDGIAHKQGRINDAISLIGKIESVLAEGKSLIDALSWFSPSSKDMVLIDDGKLGVGFMRDGGRCSLISLFDFRSGEEFLGPPLPLWSFNYTGFDGKISTIVSDNASVQPELSISGTSGSKRTITVKWVSKDCPVNFTAQSNMTLENGGLSMDFSIDNKSNDCGLNEVVFPQVAFDRIGVSPADDFAITPKSSGILYEAPLQKKPCEFGGMYPNGWAAMQFGAYYDQKTGIYFAAEDPLGSTKDIGIKSEAGTIKFTVRWPAPDYGKPGNDFSLSGQAVLKPFEGDWFDASQIYKSFVSAKAGWWPEKGKRTDTPQWFKDVAMWACTSGSAKECVKKVIKLAEFVGVPTAFHWYCWHQNPFDNDYPHYFPTKDDFADGVKELQNAGVYVMPYINGRLWDTRDKGMEDFEFTSVALPSATKDKNGKPYIESYGSKESDGSDVKLAVMCPSTKLWQNTIKDVVLRLASSEFGVNGVYIDQIAAASPVLCFDSSHGHPLGGGHWWTESGYWPLLSAIQQKLDKNYPGKIITTECNGEPYIRFLDGYLTWHFQEQDQIPLFAAVYGGKVQLFSRSYGGSDPKAHCMKAGQQLVFGEQIGWLEPGIVTGNKKVGAFIRKMARLRYALRQYLAVGEMARPPILHGEIPKITANWAWVTSKWLVTTDVLMAGTWKDDTGSLAMIFVNVSSTDTVSAEVVFDGAKYGFSSRKTLKMIVRDDEVCQDPIDVPVSFKRTIELPERSAVVWEIK